MLKSHVFMLTGDTYSRFAQEYVIRIIRMLPRSKWPGQASNNHTLVRVLFRGWVGKHMLKFTVDDFDWYDDVSDRFVDAASFLNLKPCLRRLLTLCALPLVALILPILRRAFGNVWNLKCVPCNR